jgi:hypothetical protein
VRPPWGRDLPSDNNQSALGCSWRRHKEKKRDLTPPPPKKTPTPQGLTTALSHSQIMDLICILVHALKCLHSFTLFATRAQWSGGTTHGSRVSRLRHISCCRSSGYEAWRERRVECIASIARTLSGGAGRPGPGWSCGLGGRGGRGQRRWGRGGGCMRVLDASAGELAGG